jgi:cytochrome c oxidase subunit 2
LYDSCFESIMQSFRARLAGAGGPSGPLRVGSGQTGSAGSAAILALLLAILVIATVYIFAARLFPAPPAITSIGLQVDRQYRLTLYATGVVFVLAQLGLAFAAFRFRDRGQRVQFSRGSILLEILWTSATMIIFLGLGISGRKAWAEARMAEPAVDAIPIEVTESQFQFYFRYAGADGKFGMLVPEMISSATGNPLGLDDADSAGKDDIVVTSALTVPVNRPIELLIRSQDVIHNFFVRELRLQQDAVPGLIVPLNFTATRIGKYEIVCTQLCGLGHFRMHNSLDVVSEADYEAFLAQQAARQ